MHVEKFFHLFSDSINHHKFKKRLLRFFKSYFKRLLNILIDYLSLIIINYNKIHGYTKENKPKQINYWRQPTQSEENSLSTPNNVIQFQIHNVTNFKLELSKPFHNIKYFYSFLFLNVELKS